MMHRPMWVRAAAILGSLLVLEAAAPAQEGRGSRPPGRGEAGRAGRRDRGRRNEVVLEQALEAMLKAPAEGKLAAFTDVTTALARRARQDGLPSSWDRPEAQYTAEYIAFRARWLDRLRQDPPSLEFLHELVRHPGQHDLEEITAAQYLADHPTAADVSAMLDGYATLEPADGFRSSRTRQLGRAASRLVEEDPGEEAGLLAAIVVDRFRQEIAGDDNFVRGGALEGLYRAGHGAEAFDHLRRLLQEEQNPEVGFELLQSCPRLLEAEGFDPFLKAKAIDVARTAAEIGIERSLSGAEMTRSARNSSAMVRNAIDFLQRVAPATQIDFFVSCLEQPERASVLGMDGIQTVRIALQRARQSASPEQAGRLDQMFLRILMQAGERLFVLAEEPMTDAEYSEFYKQRDVRYNAANYFCTLWDGTPSIPTLFEPSEVEDYLCVVVNAGELVEDGEGPDRLVYGIKEKVETRVLCAQILALVQRDLGRSPEEVDLYAFLVKTLAEEVRASAEEVRSALDRQVQLNVPELLIEVPVVRAPADAWVKDQVVDALGILGCTIHESSERIEIGLPVVAGS